MMKRIPARNSDLQEIATELDTLITDLPAPQVYPAFKFDDGVLHLTSPPDLRAIASENAIFKAFKKTIYDLEQALIGNNAYADFSIIVKQSELARPLPQPLKKTF